MQLKEILRGSCGQPNVGFGYEHAPSMQVEKEGVMFGSTKRKDLSSHWKEKQAKYCGNIK